MMDMNTAWATELVAEFNSAIRGGNPKAAVQFELIKEESLEMVTAANAMIDNPTVETTEAWLKEVADVIYVMAGLLVAEPDEDWQPTAQDADCLAFIAYVIDMATSFCPTATMREAVIRVHKSNMSKLDENGKPIFNEDGKVLKGPNYEPPVLTDLAEEVLETYLEQIEGREAELVA